MRCLSVLFFVLAFSLVSCSEKKEDHATGTVKSVQKPLSSANVLINLNAYIPKNIELHYKGTRMRSWLTDTNVRDIVSCVNRVYKNTDVQYQLGSINRIDPVRSNLESKLKLIVTVNRQDSYQKQRELKQARVSIFPLKYREANDVGGTINVFFLPFTGNTRQGDTSRKIGSINDVYIGEWSNKFAADGVPHKRRLVATGKPNLCKTVAHEIGHVLGLRHIKGSGAEYRQQQKIRLMGGNAGTQLTSDEISRLHQQAKKIVGK
jgi:hypothetical protein